MATQFSRLLHQAVTPATRVQPKKPVILVTRVRLKKPVTLAIHVLPKSLVILATHARLKRKILAQPARQIIKLIRANGFSGLPFSFQSRREL